MIPDTDELGIYHVHGFLPQEKDNYDNLAKSLFKELGVNVIWIDKFSEIPNLLKQIKGNYENYLPAYPNIL